VAENVRDAEAHHGTADRVAELELALAMTATHLKKSRGIHFDLTINLGHVLTACAFLVTTAVAWAQTNARLERLERDVPDMKTDARAADTRIELDLGRRIVEVRQHVDATQGRTAEDIKDIKAIIRDGFKDLDAKLDRKADRPGR
jgi:hypothetical protein